ncbi:MAG: vWA domain-containing protein, partial [Candidatus Promineifilaceae bacterium]
MAFLTPALLLLGLLAVPILLLYMLRLRRREVRVSSTLLWQRLVRDRQANAPWQRLRRSLLLFLQLAILAALVVALARPFLPVPVVLSGSVVVLLDGSASMLATDVAPGRFEAARAEVERLIGRLGGDDRMTLILVGRKPTLLATASADRAELRRALEAAAAAPVVADWEAALALAAGAAQGFSQAQIAIVSDGGLPAAAPPLPAELFYLPAGHSGENLALSALAARRVAGRNQLYASVSNYGLADRRALLSLELDGALADSRFLDVPAGASSGLTLDIPAGVDVVAARLSEQAEDYLAADNAAWTVAQAAQNGRVLLVSEGNRFLETAFGLL